MKERSVMTKKQALEIIKELSHHIYMMGANDMEIPEINRIIKELEKGKLFPKDAVDSVRKILASKSDYH